MLVPATALAGPALVISRTAEGVSRIELVAVLFAGIGSVAPTGAVTVAVLSSEPMVLDAIKPVTVNVARPPASSVTVVAMLPVPDAEAQLDPVSATQVQVGPTSATGNTSVTLAAATGLGPRLVTTI